MPITIEWPGIAFRLALTVVAGTLIGLNRSEHGHLAGLRTTLLVCLAASVSMIQVNSAHYSLIVRCLMHE
jgi:putative Mg2+ transporter-C (MgtC) family protein